MRSRFCRSNVRSAKHYGKCIWNCSRAVIYAVADHAFSAACNAYGKTSLGLSTTIQFIESAKPGDKVVARATEVKRNYLTGFYRIDVLHEQNLIATMEAVSYRKDHYFIELDDEQD
ncbi:PaaI family thioesterase [Bacillus sp. BA3]|uniref:PaaI family thioesterase n=1 Tax=Bacillus sp. BA3 TaxID=2057910 RepID=UPI00336A4959